MNTPIQPITNSTNRSPFRHAFLLIALTVLTCFALSPAAQAVNPPPDGGYPNGNTAEGTQALFSLTTGVENTAAGFQALYSNTNGSSNTANGYQTLYSNTSGSLNTATGRFALLSNTTGTGNTADGSSALKFNTTGVLNTAIGRLALTSNTTGSSNTAAGWNALAGNTSGSGNTASGNAALFSNTDGASNTANGFGTLQSNTTGSANTASGVSALFSNTTGGNNTANGVVALYSNTSGSNNIALGLFAGDNLTTGDNNIDIGNEGVADEGNTIRIGTQGIQTATFVAGISGVGVTGSAVLVSSSGQLGVRPSSQRFKTEIKSMDKASEAVLALKPVTFRYKKNIDPQSIPQFGLVAEDVAKVNPDLVARDAKGEVYTVRYEAVNAMLLNEFLKEHRKVQDLKSTVEQREATVAQQQKEFESKIADQQKQIETLTAGLQKVSAQIEASKAAPQMVINNQ